MTDLMVHDCAEVHVAPEPACEISDSELASLRPSPRRAPAIVARRAEILGLTLHQATGRGYPIWPLLIILAVAATYLYVGLVIR